MTKQFAFNLLAVLLMTCLFYECRQEVLAAPVALKASPSALVKRALPGLASAQAPICAASNRVAHQDLKDKMTGSDRKEAVAGKQQAGVVIPGKASGFADYPYQILKKPARNKIPPALKRVLRAQELASPHHKNFISLSS